MATVICKDCGGEVSSRVKACPHCGAPVKRKISCLGIIGYIFIAVILISILPAIFSDKKSTPPIQTTPPPPTESLTPSPSTQPVTATPKPVQQKSESIPEAKPTTPDWAARLAELKAEYLPKFQAPKVGSQITLKLKGGGTQEGIIRSLTDSEIHIVRGPGTIGYSKAHLDTESRVLCFADDYAAYNAYQQAKHERDTYEAGERAKKADIEAKQKAEQDARLAAGRQKRIESGFSAWNGSHIELTRLIKKTMNDPKSFDHVETTYGDMGEYLLVKTTFRGKNAFGGLVVNWISAKCDLDGHVLEVTGQGP